MSNVRKKLGISAAQIEETAKKAIRGSGFVTQRNRCLQFVREVIGATKKGSWPLPIGPNAAEAFELLKDRGYSIPLSHGSKSGDLLFKAPTKNVPDGHVGIRISGNRVAENSAVHATSATDDARGIRTLREFGQYQGVIRLSDD